jgi:hypothetical protein
MLPEFNHHSPSKANLFAAQPAMWVLEVILALKQPVSLPAHRGVAVEDGVTAGLANLDEPLANCIDVALTKFDTLTAMSGDPRQDKYRASVPDMVKAALTELRQYGKPSAMQRRVEVKHDDLAYPILGFLDYEWDHHGILLDLKTSEKMPGQIKTNHARQVAHYSGGNMEARIAYVTPRKLEVYGLENIAEHRQSLVAICKRIEKFRSLSDDPDFFVSITVPDVDSFYWSSPAARALAFQIWGI